MKTESLTKTKKETDESLNHDKCNSQSEIKMNIKTTGHFIQEQLTTVIVREKVNDVKR